MRTKAGVAVALFPNSLKWGPRQGLTSTEAASLGREQHFREDLSSYNWKEKQLLKNSLVSSTEQTLLGHLEAMCRTTREDEGGMSHPADF